MKVHESAGKKVPRSLLTNIPHLVSEYYTVKPDLKRDSQLISFGTSGHRGTSFDGSFNEEHILAISQAICEYRNREKINGPLFLGKDTHALSEPAMITALEVFGAFGVEVVVQKNNGYTPTPVISHAILTHNANKNNKIGDGVIVTPSHNPPHHGGFKYNSPLGGPASAIITKKIQNRANEILNNGVKHVPRFSYKKVLNSDRTYKYDYITTYVEDLINVIDLEIIANAKVKIGIDPLGGSGIHFWDPIADRYGLDLTIVNKKIDPTFSFMTLDKDGKIRMDCSSPYAMASLIKYRDKFDVAFGNDPDYDRHGIVTRESGLLNPNHYLSVAIWYLFKNRPDWNSEMLIGKTLVSSSMIDRISKKLNRRVCEVPVGFKWFVDGLIQGSYGFAGEESAGASFLRRNGSVWTTDKDGIIMGLLAAEIIAKSGMDPSQIYDDLTKHFGTPFYERLDVSVTAKEKKQLKSLSSIKITKRELAGEKILGKLTKAPGNNVNIGGIKVFTKNGWFAVRPSGTENIYKIYSESFKSCDHLKKIQNEAKDIIKIFFKNTPK